VSTFSRWKSTALPLKDIRRCAGDAEFLAAVSGLYKDLDAEIANRRPVCHNRGECCRFAGFGHCLFVTSVELAYFCAKVPQLLAPEAGRASCPYQQRSRCAARSARPTGCRIFFCDPAAEPWQPAQTEAALSRLKDLGLRFEMPYAYVEWIAALQSLCIQTSNSYSPAPGAPAHPV
jgi:hypothetical protein